MESLKDFCDEIQTKLKNENNLVLIAGASSSGKSFAADKLKTKLEEGGRKVLCFSADMYYKGVAATICQKAFMSNKFESFKNSYNEIVKVVKECITKVNFDNRLKGDNLISTENSLKDVLGKSSKSFCSEIARHFADINFDEPFAIDFDKLANDINLLRNNQSIILPTYSFITSEVEFESKNKVCGKDFDTIIVEGLYTLRDEFLNKLEKRPTVTACIKCDLKTILARRFNRDIKTDRCAYTPEQTIISFITQVMPAFYTYINPSFENANVVLQTTLSESEIKSKQENLQVKFKTNSYIEEILKYHGARKIDSINQKDYFFKDLTSKNQNNIILRLRSEQNKAKSLTIKIPLKNAKRAIEEYDLEKQLCYANRDIKKLLEKFDNSGYESQVVVNKKRDLYVLDNVILRVDNVENVGVFVEIEKNNNSNKIKEIIKKLELKNTTFKSYYDLSIAASKHSNIECERKYKITNLKESEMQNFLKQNIKQYYFDLASQETVKKINTIFSGAVSLENIAEARVRIVNGNVAYFTLKSDGDEQRQEYEKEFSITLANKYILDATSMLEKNRYSANLHYDNIKVEVDFYKNRSLTVMEIEYNKNLFSANKIDLIAKTMFCDENIKIENATNDKSLKNKNLAISFLF